VNEQLKDFAKRVNETLDQRAKAMSERAGNMWKGPVGIEEAVMYTREDVFVALGMVRELANILATVDGDEKHGP